MSDAIAARELRSYPARLFEIARLSLESLVRDPIHARRVVAARRLQRDVLILLMAGGVLVATLMLGVDAMAITLMPPRGSPGLWWARVLTDFGKDSYVLEALAIALLAILLALPPCQGRWRSLLSRLGVHLQFIFIAVASANLLAEILKHVLGRGRPFVGGKANPFNFVPFAGTEAYFSLPSAHAVTAFALATAAGAIWPRARVGLFTYALGIAATRLLLLAHHPSDVVAGAMIGILAGLVVRYWFAVRRLGFGIRKDGQIVPI